MEPVVGVKLLANRQLTRQDIYDGVVSSYTPLGPEDTMGNGSQYVGSA